jgi:dTDP-4-dehydrorhamnose reductase
VLIFGRNGQVSHELARACSIYGDVRLCGSDEVRLENADQVVEVIRSYKPTEIINAAAYTAVDKAESEVELVKSINGTGVGVIAEEAKKIAARFLHYSTDYVFDGTKIGSYNEDDVPNPIGVYGESKLLGESFLQQIDAASVVLRVSWIYGNHGKNFYKTMMKMGKEREELSVVGDQVGSPTWSRHIAEATVAVLFSPLFPNRNQVYHLTPSGHTSWHGFSEKIFDLVRGNGPDILKVKNVKKINTEEYPTPARRPKNSVMNSEKIKKDFNIALPNWDKSLEMVIADYFDSKIF